MNFIPTFYPKVKYLIIFARLLSTFYAFDERGNVAQRLNSSSTVQSSDIYDGYGARSSTGGSDVWGFEAQAGYYTDAETGLILCTHRFYDVRTGRWLTRDPIIYKGGINLYGYIQNGPLHGVDPLGLWNLGIVIGGTIGAGLFGAGGGISGSVGISIDGTGNIAFVWNNAGYATGTGEIVSGGIGLTGGSANLSNGTTPVYTVGGNFGDFSGSVSTPIRGGPTQWSFTIGPGEGGFGGGGVGLNGGKIIGHLPSLPSPPDPNGLDRCVNKGIYDLYHQDM